MLLSAGAWAGVSSSSACVQKWHELCLSETSSQKQQFYSESCCLAGGFHVLLGLEDEDRVQLETGGWTCSTALQCWLSWSSVSTTVELSQHCKSVPY